MPEAGRFRASGIRTSTMRPLSLIRVFAALLGSILVPFPCHAAIQVTGGLTKEFEVAPGKSYEGSIEVKNPEEAPQEIKAYQTDYFFYADGRALYGDPGGLPRSNAAWISLSPRQVLIPAGETVNLHFSIQVPNDATMTGTYWSNIMVEPIPEGSPESSGSKDIGVGVRQVLRYAVQVVTHIGSTGTRMLKFNQIRLASENGERLLSVDAENTGERWLRGNLWVDLYDSKGAYAGRFEGGRQRMYPGTSARFTVDLVGVKSASYKALIVVDCGDDDVFGANVSLVLKE